MTRRLQRALGWGAYVAVLIGAPAASASTVADVDPFIGTAGLGNTAPGAQLPFGFASPGPDTWPSESSGYRSGAPIVGFSQTHVSGTGGAGRYGNFRLTPVHGTPSLAGAEEWLASPATDERAEPGYYGVTLAKPQARVELTASRRAAFHRYAFADATANGVQIDVSSRVGGDGHGAQRPVRSAITRTGPRTFEGSTTMAGGWGAGEYTLYFALETDSAPTGVRIFRGTEWLAGDGARAGSERLGAVLGVDGRGPVEVKVGVSFVSTARALQNLRRELTAGFDAVRNGAARAWERTLETIDVEGGTDAQRRLFATSLYHAHLMPHDLTGENAWWRSRRPHYEDFFTLWDTFRTVHPLLTLVQARRQAEMVQSLVETYQHTGWMPDARIAGNNGLTQGGTNGDVLVADALAKGLRGIDYRTAYRALRKNAEVDSRRHYAQGRQIADYKRLGYVPSHLSRSASRTMEYAYNDFAVAQVARRLGTASDARRYLVRSRNWRKLWKPGISSVAPRDAGGQSVPGFSPLWTFYGWADPFWEGSALQYSTYVPHDARGLIERLGGERRAVRWLDRFFAERGRAGYVPGNQPSLLAPFLYIHAGRPDRTAKWVRWTARTVYRAERDALPGNDDAGTLSAWYVWAAIGLYPNAGQPFYYIGSPLFRRSRIALSGGRRFTVSAPDTSAQNVYVTGARLNGKRICRAFLGHREIAAGGVLELEMGPRPKGWGTCVRPPSLAR